MSSGTKHVRLVVPPQLAGYSAGGGRGLVAGETLLEGVIPESIMVPDLVFALRRGGVHVVIVEAEAPAKAQQRHKVAAQV